MNATGDGGSGALYRTIGSPFEPIFNSAAVQVIAAGMVSVIFTDANDGQLSYTADGASATKSITRQLF